MVEIAGEAAVFAVTVFLLQVAVPFQIGEGAFYRAPGEAEIGRDGLDPRPALAFGGGHALEVHVDGFCPMRQVVVGIDRVKIADGVTSLYYREVVFATQFEFMCYTVEDAVDWLSPPTA